MKSENLIDHMLISYHALRIALAVIAVLLPFILILGGYAFYGIPRQGELSAYYFAQTPGQSHVGIFPMRSWFVGILCAVGSMLIVYRGYSNTENWVLNFAGISAIATAIIHMSVPDGCGSICGGDYFPLFPSAHFICAVLFFFFMVWVSFACSGETLKHVTDEKKFARYKRDYDILSATMLIVVVVVPILAVIASPKRSLPDSLIMPVELAGIFLFAIYWWRKTQEIQESGADKKIFSQQRYDQTDGKEQRLRPRSFRTKAGRIFDRDDTATQ